MQARLALRATPGRRLDRWDTRILQAARRRASKEGKSE
jgi:hypothetical protein